MQRNIFAYTAPGSDFPEYVSINDNGGQFQITVRGPKQRKFTMGHPDMWCGDLACMTLPRDQIAALRDALTAELERATNGGLSKTFQFTAPAPHSDMKVG